MTRISPSVVVAMLAIFVTLGGVGYSATGDTFIVGKSGNATSQTSLSATTAGKTLVLTNIETAVTSKALALNVPAGHPPLEVNSGAKVASLNADRLDDVDSGAFARLGVARTSGAGLASGVIDVTNSSNGNGAAGTTSDVGASGVYGENLGGMGYGVAGRAGITGKAVYGDNTGGGWAGLFNGRLFVGADVSCTIKCLAPAFIAGPVGATDNLDARDSSAFVQGGGDAGQFTALLSVSESVDTSWAVGFITLTFHCSAAPGTDGGAVDVVNGSSLAANMFYEHGGITTHRLLQAGERVGFPLSAPADRFHIQAQGADGVETIDGGMSMPTFHCQPQAEAVRTR
jgi:hypothetical protein